MYSPAIALYNWLSHLISGVMFFLGGMLYPNNSNIAMTAIGRGVNALYCLTNLTTCCTSEQGGVAGEWFLPDDSAAYTTSRTASAVLLNRIAGEPSGIFTCRIPDGTGPLRTAYVGVKTSTILSWQRVTCTMLLFHPQVPLSSLDWRIIART